MSQLRATERRLTPPGRSLPKLTERTTSRRADLRAALDRAFVEGYAVEWQEFEEGIGCGSAPCFGVAGGVAGLLTVVMPLARLDVDEADVAQVVMVHAAAATYPAARSGHRG